MSLSVTHRRVGSLLALVSIHLLYISIAPAEAPAHLDDSTSATDAVLHLDISIFDAVPMSEGALANLRDELEQIFATIGVQVSWVDRATSPEHASECLEFRAIILPIQPTSWGFRPRAMGTVLSLDPPHTVFIFFPTIVRTVMRLESSYYGRYGADCRLVARGMARIMAHEMLHVLAPGLPHSEEGLMKRALNRNDLLLERPVIDPAFADAFRRTLLAGNKTKRLLLGASSPHSGGH